MLYLNQLKKVLLIPKSPVESPNSDDWQVIEAGIGSSLPEDYKQFISQYGTGKIDDFLCVLNPISKNRYLNLSDAGRTYLQAMSDLSDDFGEQLPYPLYPDKNGILPWAISDNGDVLYWVCKGNPSQWSIVVNESHGPRWREFQMSTTEFLSKLLNKEVVVDVFPNDFPIDSPEFTIIK